MLDISDWFDILSHEELCEAWELARDHITFRSELIRSIFPVECRQWEIEMENRYGYSAH